MNMDTLTLWQAVADYRTRLAGFGFVVMICLGLPCHSYSQNQSAEGLADKLQGDINPRSLPGGLKRLKRVQRPQSYMIFSGQCQKAATFIYISQDLSFQNGGWSWHWLHRSGDMPTSPGLR